MSPKGARLTRVQGIGSSPPQYGRDMASPDDECCRIRCQAGGADFIVAPTVWLPPDTASRSLAATRHMNRPMLRSFTAPLRLVVPAVPRCRNPAAVPNADRHRRSSVGHLRELLARLNRREDPCCLGRPLHAYRMHELARADCRRSGGSRLRVSGPVSRARSKVPGAGSTLGLSKPPWIRMGVSSATELVVDGAERIVTSSHLFNRSICPKPSMVPSEVTRRISASGPARPCKSAMASRQVMRALPFPPPNSTRRSAAAIA